MAILWTVVIVLLLTSPRFWKAVAMGLAVGLLVDNLGLGGAVAVLIIGGAAVAAVAAQRRRREGNVTIEVEIHKRG